MTDGRIPPTGNEEFAESLLGAIGTALMGAARSTTSSSGMARRSDCSAWRTPDVLGRGFLELRMAPLDARR